MGTDLTGISQTTKRDGGISKIKRDYVNQLKGWWESVKGMVGIGQMDGGNLSKRMARIGERDGGNR